MENKRWIFEDGNQQAELKAQEMQQHLQAYGTINVDEKNEKFFKNVKNLGSNQRRKAMLKDAESRNYKSDKDFDKDNNLYNLSNGTYNLKTWQLQPHNPKDFITKISPVIFDETAKSIEFINFITEITCGDNELARFLQKILGLSLSGDILEECFFIFYGPRGRNGKSSLIETISYLHGGTDGYAIQTAAETFAFSPYKNSRTASGDIARMTRRRFISTTELPAGLNMDTPLLKSLTGGDTVVARRLYQEERQFKQTGKIYMHTNYLPYTSDRTLFESQRVYVVPFDRYFKIEERDKGLKSRLITPANLSGIFNWLIEGLKIYMEEGLNPPLRVLEATKAFKNNSDKFEKFLKECFEPAENNFTSMSEAYEMFKNWCQNQGIAIERLKEFKEMLKKYGVFKDREGSVYNVIAGYTPRKNCKF